MLYDVRRWAKNVCMCVRRMVFKAYMHTGHMRKGVFGWMDGGAHAHAFSRRSTTIHLEAACVCVHVDRAEWK